jgi:hypothetical protein
MFWFRSDNWLRYRNVCASVLVSLTLLVFTCTLHVLHIYDLFEMLANVMVHRRNTLESCFSFHFWYFISCPIFHFMSCISLHVLYLITYPVSHFMSCISLHVLYLISYSVSHICKLFHVRVSFYIVSFISCTVFMSCALLHIMSVYFMYYIPFHVMYFSSCSAIHFAYFTLCHVIVAWPICTVFIFY